MKAVKLLAFGLIGYLCGSFSFGRIVGRFVAPDVDMADTTLAMPGGAEIDYRGVSATSVAVKTGPTWGIVTGVLDTGKAYVPTLLTMRRWPNQPYHAAVAVGAIVGHNYPLYHGFNGGRGQTPFYGGMLAMDPVAVPITNTVGVAVGIGVFREMLASYTLGMWFAIPWFLWRKRTPETIFAVAGNLLFSVRVIPEIKDYIELRRSGEMASVGNWRDFFSSYPALDPYRDETSEAPDTSPT